MCSSKMRYSVVIPTYDNHEGCSKLIRSIEDAFSGSVLKCKELEIIIVDDYPDDPFSVTSSLQLRILRNSKNMGGGYTRNKGAKEASGDYIIFLDDDTTVMKDFFMRVDRFIRRNDPDIFSGMIIPEVHDVPSIFFTIMQNLARKANYLCTTNLIVKKEFSVLFPVEKEYGMVADYMYFHRLSRGLKIFYVKEFFITHRRLGVFQGFKKLYLTSLMARDIQKRHGFRLRDLDHHIEEKGRYSLKDHYSSLSYLKKAVLGLYGLTYLFIYSILNKDYRWITILQRVR